MSRTLLLGKVARHSVGKGMYARILGSNVLSASFAVQASSPRGFGREEELYKTSTKSYQNGEIKKEADELLSG